jgi:membrane protein implicated in regulation of membrane protease activity
MNALEIVFWYWWVLALGFLGLEMLVTGFFFLWLAVSAFVTGSLLLVIPVMSFDVQLLLFSLMAIVSVMVWRRYVSAKAQTSDHPLLNRRGAQYLGRTFNLVEAIENGQGKIKVDDSLWKVNGPDCPVGTKVKIIAINGTVFDVEEVH